jgi:methylthioribulose-1-phosphate dehydratase
MDYQISNKETDKKKIICFLLRQFYSKGWCTGSGGGISIREDEQRIWIAPSGVHKELVQSEDMFLMDLDGKVLEGNEKLKCSVCTPLFLQAYKLRNAGAVLHTHSINALLITNLFENEFQCTNLEMLKGIQGHKNTDWCRVPIIENTEFEPELTESLKNAIIAYPNSNAVLVRNHGVYIWGNTWEKAKIHAEVYDYLFEAILKLKQYCPEKLLTIKSADKHIRAWYIDSEKEALGDYKANLQHKDPQWVSANELSELGVIHVKLDGEKDNADLERICKERNYKNRDEKLIQKSMENYESMSKTFATEHLHMDEEIRYVLTGSGYFDVRSKSDEWIRIHVIKGDLIILPEGIYHRYSNDESNYIHVMRLFKEEPKWTPYNRPNDELESRKKYVQEFLKK